jgi:hypothetical protein
MIEVRHALRGTRPREAHFREFDQCCDGPRIFISGDSEQRVDLLEKPLEATERSRDGRRVPL